MSNLIIGLGNTGSNVVKLASQFASLDDVTKYTVDSVASTIDLDSIDKIKHVLIQSDEKSGSGRNRDRGKAMYEFHEEQGEFDEMYKTAENSTEPVIVITSGAGGTGSGSCVPVCKALIDREIQVIPIIVCPNKQDPAAFHLNTNDLLMELDEIGVTTYSIFENRKGDADYTPINTEIVQLIEIIFGKKYDKTDLDSIDDSDLDVILNTPGRLIAVSAEANSIPALQKELTRKLFVGFQPVWKPEDVNANTLMTAFALKSMFADVDFKQVFAEIDNRIDPDQVYDNYRNIVKADNNGVSSASVIISGLPRSDIKEIKGEYKEAEGLGAGINKSVRPNFMKKKKASVDRVTLGNNEKPLNKFKWH